MRSFALYPGIRIVGVYDRDAARLDAFCAHWKLPGFATQEALFKTLPKGALILNLTNPREHFDVSLACLKAGFNIFSEKPLTLEMEDARALHAVADEAGLHIASAPSSVLGEAAQTLGHALRHDTAGMPRLVYAELDDGFIRQAPFKDWESESGAKWPSVDEFATGCTLEHAGYYLSWLIAWFGPVESVTSASADVSGSGEAPDFSSATLFFTSGMVARLTTSIIASHDHQMRVFCDIGVLKIKRAWDNAAPVRFHRRFTLRRKLIEHPFGKRIRLGGDTHPKVKRFGAAAMNFALGPVEMLEALAEGRAPRLSGDYALHLNEVTLALQAGCGAQDMTTTCNAMEPMPWAR
ncbi:MAG: Gfo/Idh/MocA family oxidoreductase [Alphaproteobacteria bacterium]|nr:Gfo/Idh/MocA family oxidoreductase [Alphaproteobacteria bacterium]